MKLTKISSYQNPLIKKIKKINENLSFAKKQNLFLIEKRKLVFEAINKKIDIQFILLTNDEFEENKKLLTQFINKNKIIIIEEKIAKYISNNQSISNIFALCRYSINKNLNIRNNQNYLLLDSIQDPGNLGTIIRSGFGLGIDSIFIYNCVYLFNNKCTNSCSGANFNKNIYIINDIDEFINLLPNYDIISTSLDNDSQNMNDIKFRKYNNLIILGNEGHGISEKIKKISYKKIKLPMQNNIESLNVAAFAAIICYKILH